MKEKINTQLAPQAIGPYCQGTVYQNLIFTSGQLPLDPKTMEIMDSTIEAQARQSLDNLKAILISGGADLDSVLKTTCFLANIEDFVAFNQVYTEYFGEGAPARSCFEVACLPKNALIEIEAIAYRK